MNDAAAAPERRSRPAPWTASVALAALVGGAVVFDVPICPCALLLGVPCPGCGLGRASLAMLAGRLDLALALHPLVPVALPALLVALVSPAIPAARIPRSARGMASVGAVALLGALLGVWGARFGGAFGGAVPVDGPCWAELRLTR